MFITDDCLGKQCNVHIILSKEGVIGEDLRAEGYQPLCEAAVKAIRKASIPAAPDDETYEYFRRPTLDFMPR